MARSTAFTGYSTAEVASLLELPPARLRSLARHGLGTLRRGRRGEYRFSFQDVVLLRAAKGLLAAGVPLSRVGRALSRLPEQLPGGRSLSAVRLSSEGGEIVVQEGDRRWNPESGQALLDFAVADLATAAAPLALRRVQAAEAVAHADADDWYDLGYDLEASSPEQAAEAYRRAIRAAPAHAAALLNLGRLLHEAGRIDEAEACYRRALAADPADPLAWFNLGVALQDRERWEEAAEAYRRAIEADPGSADGHYNLAVVCERLGLVAEGLKHLKEARRLGGG